MSNPHHRNETNSAATHSRWAPWWLYLVLILGLNYLRQWLVPHGTLPPWGDVALAVVLAVTVFGVVTVAFRAARR